MQISEISSSIQKPNPRTFFHNTSAHRDMPKRTSDHDVLIEIRDFMKELKEDTTKIAASLHYIAKNARAAAIFTNFLPTSQNLHQKVEDDDAHDDAHDDDTHDDDTHDNARDEHEQGKPEKRRERPFAVSEQGEPKRRRPGGARKESEQEEPKKRPRGRPRKNKMALLPPPNPPSKFKHTEQYKQDEQDKQGDDGFIVMIPPIKKKLL